MILRCWLLLLTATISIDIGFGLDALNGLKQGVLYQYEWSSRTRLTNNDDTKTIDEDDDNGDRAETSAIVSIQLLHHDRDTGRRILVIWADNCVNAYCPQQSKKDGEPGLSTNPLKLFSIWHGSKISSVLAPESQPLEKWDILQSILFQLQFQLNVVKLRPAGHCELQYSETNPITRRLTCDLVEQASLLSKAFNALSSFTQTNHYYFDEQSKLRRLSIGERYELSSQYHRDANTVLISQSTLKMIDHSDSAVDHSDVAVDFNAYIEVLKKDHGLRQYGDSVEHLFTTATTSTDLAAVSPSLSQGDDKCGHLGGVKKLRRLSPSASAKSNAALKAFIELAKHLKSADQSHLSNCLSALGQNHKSLVGPLLESIAIAGTGASQEIALKFLESSSSASKLRPPYLLMLAHNLWPKKVAKEVLEHFEKSVGPSAGDVDEYLGLAVAALVRRSDDAELQNRLVKTLDGLLSSCESDKCLKATLRALRNLAHHDTARYVKRFLCHKSELLVQEALEGLRSVDARHWTNETLHDLARVYADECPTGKSDPTCRTIAAELILKAAPNRRWSIDVGPLLLTPISSSSDHKKWRRKREREVFTFSLSKMFDLAGMNAEYRKEVSASVERLLQSDYSRLAHGGMSAVHTGVAVFPLLASLGQPVYQLNMEFGGGILKRSNVDIAMEDKDGVVSQLLSFALFSRGVEALVGETDHSPPAEDGGDDVPQKEDEATAGMRLSLFDQLQPPLTFFTGQSELISAVWSASGEPMTAFDGRFLLSSVRGAIPLASGHVALVDYTAALRWTLTGAIEISLWYKNAHNVITSRTTAVAKGQITVYELGSGRLKNKYVLQDNNTVFGELMVDFVTDVDFSQPPFRLCLQMNQHPVQIDYLQSQKTFETPTSKEQIRKRGKTIRLGGQCFVTEPNIIRQCGRLLEDLGRA